MVTEINRDYDAQIEDNKWSIRTANVYKKEGLEGCDDSWLVDGYIYHNALGVLNYKWYWNGFNVHDNLHAQHLHISEVEQGRRRCFADVSVFSRLIQREDPITQYEAGFGWGKEFVPIFDCLSMDIQSRFDYIHSVYEGNMQKVYQEDQFFTRVDREDIHV